MRWFRRKKYEEPKEHPVTKKKWSIKFSDIEHEAKEAIQEKLKLSPISGENGFHFIEGFFYPQLLSSFSSDIILGGTALPMVGVVGKTTGRIYTFALYALLPRLKDD